VNSYRLLNYWAQFGSRTERAHLNKFTILLPLLFFKILQRPLLADPTLSTSPKPRSDPQKTRFLRVCDCGTGAQRGAEVMRPSKNVEKSPH
jgi:hypothetical protein